MTTDQVVAVQAYLTAVVVGGVGAVRRRVALARGADPERGNITMQQVIWYAVGAVLAITVAGIIVAAVMAKVNSVDLDTPTP